MNRSRSNTRLENQGQPELSDEQLYRLILQAYDEKKSDVEQLQLTIKGIMIADPERIRVAYRKVVEAKGKSRTNAEPRPPPEPQIKVLAITLAEAGSLGTRASQRRKMSQAAKTEKNLMSVIVDASVLRESRGLEPLKFEMSALCRVQHQNLLNLIFFTAVKGNRFILDFDLASTSHVTLLDMFQEAESGSLNGCEVACVLAQASLGMLFLVDCAAPALRPIELDPAECLRTENIILTDRGLIKLCGHHPVIRLPRARPLRASPEEDRGALGFEGADEPQEIRDRPGLLAHRVAMLLYELDHPTHQPLRSVSQCPALQRDLLDKRYAQLFSLCAEWEPDDPMDLRNVLYSDFINEQTSAINSYQVPLEIVFASRFN